MLKIVKETFDTAELVSNFTVICKKRVKLQFQRRSRVFHTPFSIEQHKSGNDRVVDALEFYKFYVKNLQATFRRFI